MHFMQRCMALLLLKALCVLSSIADFSVTDPACDRLIPTYNANRVMAFTLTKFRIRTHAVNGSETFEYGHQPIQVSVEGAPYTRVLIQARAIMAPTQQVGNFGEPMSEYFKIVTCGGQPATAAIIDRNVTRRHDGVTWNPPNFPIGPIVFFASPIEVSPNKVLYPTRSHFLSPEIHKATVDAVNCGRSHSCLSIGDDNCLFGRNCTLSIKWICYQDRILVEVLYRGNIGSFGFAQSNNYSVMCLATNHSITVEHYGLQTGRIVPSYRRPLDYSYHKLLKALRQDDKFYCRYEMDLKDASNLFVYGSVNLQYAIPENYRFEELETSDLCKPSNFHAVFQKSFGSTLTSQLMFAGGSHLSNAHLFIAFLIVHILFQ